MGALVRTHTAQTFVTFDQQDCPPISTKIMVIVLQTWWTGRKEGGTLVSSPVNLVIEQFDPNYIIVPQLHNDADVSWKVMSVICRDGPTVESGHYWTWRRCVKDDRDNKFMKMDDNKVPLVKDCNSFGDFEHGYILLCERNWFYVNVTDIIQRFLYTDF